MMRRLTLLLLVSGALLGLQSAADAAPRKPIYKAPPPVPAASSAIAFYAGANLGLGWSHFSAATPLGTVQSIDTNGYLGGAQVGANYQIGKIVLGVEGDFTMASVQGNTNGTLGGAAFNVGARHLWFATLAGRAGYAYDRMLFYAKAGAAWTRYKYDIDVPTLGSASGAQTRTGWMVGAGIEQAVTNAVSVKAEYNYLDFGTHNDTVTTTGGFVASPGDVRLYAHLVKLGVNYRFNAGP